MCHFLWSTARLTTPDCVYPAHQAPMILGARLSCLLHVAQKRNSTQTDVDLNKQRQLHYRYCCCKRRCPHTRARRACEKDLSLFFLCFLLAEVDLDEPCPAFLLYALCCGLSVLLACLPIVPARLPLAPAPRVALTATNRRPPSTCSGCLRATRRISRPGRTWGSAISRWATSRARWRPIDEPWRS